MNYKCRLLFAAHRQSASLQLTFALNANTACRGYCSFLCPRTRASTAVVSRYTAIVMCALAHFIAAHFCTQREHRLSRLSFFFYVHAPVQARWWASCYIAIVMCAFAHFHCHSLLRSTRTPLIAVIVLFLCPRTRASTVVGILLYRYSNVRFCALPLPLTFALNANTAYRGYRSFFMSTYSCKHGGGHKKEHSHK